MESIETKTRMMVNEQF